MDILGVSKIVDGITNVVGRFIPDKNKLAEVKADLEKSISNGEIELEKIALESKKLKAKAQMAMIERVPIPALMFIYAIIITNNSIIVPYIEAFSNIDVPILSMDEGFTSLIKTIIVVLAGKKVADKSPIVTGKLNGIFSKK